MDGIIDNLQNAIQTWNEKLAEIWLLLTQSPQNFKGGGIWQIIVKIHWHVEMDHVILVIIQLVRYQIPKESFQ